MAGFSLTLNQPGWRAATKLLSKAADSVHARQVIAVKRAALLAEAEIKKGIVSQAPGGKRFKKLSPITVMLTGRRKALARSMATGLAGSITTTHDEKTNAAFVGVHRGRKGKNGQDMVNIALVHEFGTRPYAIKVTDKMRSFFFFLHFKSGGKIKFISPLQDVIWHTGVPARPFIRPTMEKIGPKLQQIITTTFTERGGPI